MEKPNIIGSEVITPDGRGCIKSLHENRVVIEVYVRDLNQNLNGKITTIKNHFSYYYNEVEIIKGSTCFDNETLIRKYNI